MQTAKQEVQELLQDLPDDATFEDIQYHIYVKQKISQGLADSMRLASDQGALVNDVTPGSPAAKIGFKVGPPASGRSAKLHLLAW